MYEFKKVEEEVLNFWKGRKIYEKSRKKNSKGKSFYMMDGPPYANGHIHMGTALNKISKDIAMRSRRIQGFDVFDRAGYDTHGVPIEFQIEKEIGSKSKQDIEKYGVKKFIDKCKEFATRYIDVMNKEFENLGVWMDFSNPYLTLDDSYIEKIWETFKKADEKGLLFLGKYPVHVCPRCETAVAYNEIEYAKQEDTSVFVKFPLKDKSKTYLVIFTTTPWTLPANTGIMAHPDFLYQEVELSNGEKWIIAKELVPKIMSSIGMGFTAKNEFPGKKMENWKYTNPLAKNLKMKLKNAYRVVLSGRYVNLEEGTGLVHCAPGHGKEDWEVGKETGLDMPCPVDTSGMLTEEAGKYAGKKAGVVDEEIMNDLESEGYLVHRFKYSHDYPFCWRCKSSLLMLNQPQWFFRISKIQKKLLSENEDIVWLPNWMQARMKAWLEGIGDWPVSRRRYWGTPLPIWVCEKCNEKKVIGSLNELKKYAGKGKLDVHKPGIDAIEIKCKCGGKMKRVPDVLDVWFDSGVSSWAALDDKQLKKFWPADLNLEGKDQVRGWWNSELILSEIRFGKRPMKNIVAHGMVLDLGKRKMSKSLGNITSPQEIIDKYGRDYLRYYFAKVSKGEDFAFDEKEFSEIQKIMAVLMNVYAFTNQIEPEKIKRHEEDKWIISKYNSLVKKVKENYDLFKFNEVIQELENFLVSDLSRTYIKIIRDRSGETCKILNEIFIGLLKIFSPIIPFVTEKIWQELKEKKIVKEESVHLSSWPKYETGKIDKKLEEEMKVAMKFIEIGLRERDKAHIGLKWPLSLAKIYTDKKIRKELEEIICRQLNVRKIEMNFDKENKEYKIELNTVMTEELETEGFAREISRAVQAERKNKEFVKTDKINLLIVAKPEFAGRISTQKKFIADRTGSRKIQVSTISDDKSKKLKNNFSVKIKDIDFEIYFEKTK